MWNASKTASSLKKRQKSAPTKCKMHGIMHMFLSTRSISKQVTLLKGVCHLTLPKNVKNLTEPNRMFWILLGHKNLERADFFCPRWFSAFSFATTGQRRVYVVLALEFAQPALFSSCRRAECFLNCSILIALSLHVYLADVLRLRFGLWKVSGYMSRMQLR